MATLQKTSDKFKLELGNRQVHQLRIHVKRLFNELLVVPPGPNDNSEARLQTAQRNVLSIQKCMHEIEIISDALDPATSSDMSLGNVGLISTDPSQDSSNLHGRASSVFRDMRRSQTVVAGPVQRGLSHQGMASMPSLEAPRLEPCAKVARKEAAPNEVESICTEWNGSHPRLQVSLQTIQPCIRILTASVVNVMTAYLQLNGDGVPAHIVVHAWEESSSPPMSSLPLGELVCASSQHRVFQEVSACCLLTLLSITASHHPVDVKAIFKDLLEWLQSYYSLFSDVCGVCKRQLSMGGSDEGPLPPCWRELKSNVVCHRSCRSL